MALKSKSTKSAVSVEDLIGLPEIKGETAQVPAKAVPEVRSAPESKPYIALPVNTKPVNSFVPGIVAAPHGGAMSNLNGTDRYSNTPTQNVSGYLDIMMEGHGFLRPKFVPSDKDIYISQSQIRKFQLREGDEVSGQARMPKENERYLGLLKVETVNKVPADKSSARPNFDDLTPIYPNKQVRLETEKLPLSTRIVDLFSPIGFGQRGMIVSPPKAGKTTIIKEIAAGISKNHPKVHLMAVLIGERPEEVTDISRSVKGEVIASNFDEAPEAQTKVAEVALDRAKRLVEMGIEVFILLDSITRLARAYNLSVNPSGRTLSGGFDPAALYPAKRFLGAARSCEEGGSLTIIGTALVETGSRMDDLIYEEFKGTGNMELHLTRALQEQRVFPAIDIEKSGTRHEELLLPPETLKKVVTLRHMLSLLGEGTEKTATLVERLNKSASNKEFLENLQKG
ncbi:MAG: transcription termination factor Rho, transcription termination factor Rho [Candidatus Gottesmanbacteria bacterium GW2011_GWA2_43_14]|uniref:Transcription termination factor Rho n=1 Tax=Candidatus Gottesmanbacteria bacterium GW2011_GWA2_43_14 TaxID=1618443 RepID=A0A0G1GFZ0_9BACT|nr:MAG: transcription termination factor Rho, transcription termination factor Rho [Candidatus Gottesmanbacteria bacterium GW2011_GWA2_43_14]